MGRRDHVWKGNQIISAAYLRQQFHILCHFILIFLKFFNILEEYKDPKEYQELPFALSLNDFLYCSLTGSLCVTNLQGTFFTNQL